MNDIIQENRASEVLGKIGRGTTDADFARAIGECLDRVKLTKKRATLKLTLEIVPRDDMGCVEMRADISTTLPKLPAPSTQMHIDDQGRLLTQQEFLLGGGPSETPRPIPVEKPASSMSGRLPVASRPAPAPIAERPAPAPVI